MKLIRINKLGEIIDAPVGMVGVEPHLLSRENCCGTLRLKEHLSQFEKNVSAALKKR